MTPTSDGRNPLPNPLPDEENRTQGSGLAGLGIQFALAIIVCVFVGQWIDRRIGTGPWGVVVGAVVGFAVGLYAMLRAAKSENSKSGVGGPGSGGTS